MADPERPICQAPAEAAQDGGVGLQDWRRLVEGALKGRSFSTLQSRTRDGIVIEPLYAPRTDALPLSRRGARRWIVVQMIDDADPDSANAQALEDIAGGATGLALRFAPPGSDAGSGLPVSQAALEAALQGVDLAAIHLRVEPHPQSLTMAGWVREVVGRQGVAPELTDIAWGLDPIALAAKELAEPKRVADTFRQIAQAGFKGPLAEVDGRAIHESGGSEAQELATLLAIAVWWMRTLDGSGVAAEAALPFFGMSLAVDHDQFVSTAKLRAARMLWARFLELCGAPLSSLRIHAETSRRMMTRSDPHTNLLRTTIAAFSAGVGGADSVTVLPFNSACGPATRSARTLARNIQHLLLEESQLHKVADPGAGSGLLESLTERLAAAAWAEFQAIEREGGIVESLRAGAFQARIAHSRKELQGLVVSGAAPLVGATIYREAAPPTPVHVESERTSYAPRLPPISLEALAEAAA